MRFNDWDKTSEATLDGWHNVMIKHVKKKKKKIAILHEIKFVTLELLRRSWVRKKQTENFKRSKFKFCRLD